MPTSILCPGCSRHLAVPENVHGYEVQCPSCGHVFIAGASRSQGPRAGGPADGPPLADAHPLADGSLGEGPLPTMTRRELWAPHDDEASHAPAQPWAGAAVLPGNGQALTTTIFLLLWIVAASIEVLINFVTLSLLQRQGAGIAISPAEAESLDSLAGLTGVAQFLIYLGAAIAFLTWIYQAYKNLQRLQIAGLSYSPGWAVGWYFVPVLNLFRPYQVMQEIWKASDSGALSQSSESWKWKRGALLLSAWWALWIAGNLISNILFSRSLRTNDMPQDALASLLHLTIIADGLHILAAICLIAIVQTVRRRQNDAYERFHAWGEEGEDALLPE